MTSKSDIAAARVLVADRVEEAWDVLRRMPDRERAMLAKGERGQTWPTMLRTAAEHAAYKRVPLRRPPPTAAQITRMHEVLDWLLALAKQERDYFQAVWLCCAERRKTAEAAKLMGCHRNSARTWRDCGLDRIAAQFGVKPRF